MRRRARRPEISLGDCDALLPVHASTAERVSKRETSLKVARAVSDLPEDERQVVVLRHYGDLSFAEIAAVLEVPNSTVKSRMARGLARLKIPLAPLDQTR
ncbi:MAG: sigma-70 family RNA polymerase sigma factor [Planctomycetota bacterium]